MSIRQIKTGSVLSNTMYLTVQSVDKYNKDIVVRDTTGLEFVVQGNDLIEGMYSADQFTETKTVNMSEAAAILESVGDAVFTVCFNKKADEATIADGLSKLSVAELTDPKRLKKHIKSLTEGEERVLVGRLIDSEAKLGRSQVVDLEITKGHNIRQVDHRTIKYIIAKGVKSVVK